MTTPAPARWDLEVEIAAVNHQVNHVLQSVWADVLGEAELALEQVSRGASTQSWLTEVAVDYRRRHQDWSSVVAEVDVLVERLCEDLLGADLPG